MNVDAAQIRCAQDRVRKYEAVGNNDCDIRVEVCEVSLFLARESIRAPQSKSQFTCRNLNGARPWPFPPPGGTWRAAIDGENVVAMCRKARECGDREFGRSHEDYTH